MKKGFTKAQVQAINEAIAGIREELNVQEISSGEAWVQLDDGDKIMGRHKRICREDDGGMSVVGWWQWPQYHNNHFIYQDIFLGKNPTKTFKRTVLL